MSSKKAKSKKVSQNDLRKMMNEMKTKRTTDPKSHAKETRSNLSKPDAYKKALNDQKRLQALIAGVPADSTENSRQKKQEYLNSSNKIKSGKNLKRPLSGKTHISDMTVEIENELATKSAKKGLKEEKDKTTGGLLIGDYGSDSEEENEEEMPEKKEDGTEKTPKDVPKKPDSTLPEGFFDDPEIDAKIRGVETPAHVMDREWEDFQKEIQRETGQSEQIVDEEEEVGKVDREIEEIDEQIMQFSRVEKLNVARDETKQKLKLLEKTKKKESSDDSDSDGIEDDLLDWREKDSHF